MGGLLAIRYWSIIQGTLPVQQYYYIPQDAFLATNTLVLIDELGVTDITQVSIVLSSMIVP